MDPSSNSRQADPLSVLLQLESSLFKTESVDALAFLLVNQLKSLITYDQAILWVQQGGQLRVVQATSVTAPDPHAPYLQWMATVVNRYLRREKPVAAMVVDAELLSGPLAREWPEHVRGNALFLPLNTDRQQMLGGLWLSRQAPWSEQEQVVLNRLAEAASVVLERHWYRRRWMTRIGGWLVRSPLRRAALLLLLVALFMIPMRQSALAPAEIVAIDPETVTAPLDGVIDRVWVEPNQYVEKGAQLFTLDDQELQSQLSIEQQEVEIAEAELLSASQKVFAGSDGEELESLRSRIEQSKRRVEWILKQLSRGRVTAPASGVVINTETHTWKGRPVRIGEGVIMLADESRIEVEMWLAVEDLLNFSESGEVDLFLYSRSNQRISARFKRVAYQSELSPQGVLAYRVTAELIDHPGGQPFRVGERGTGKIYGEETTLFFYLFRKPLQWLRQWMA